ncbi:hypothetical protein GCM10010521_12630 [Streptomyces rameus]|uniref:Uncharacterized protein n=1 Tax=Streptomyces rameus TaxID=68261 RepID=A0ABP6MVM5_9ACTN
MFGEDLHHPATALQVLVRGQDLGLPRLAARLVDGLKAVGGRLVRPDQPEVAPLARVGHHLRQQVAEDAGRLVRRHAGLVDRDGEPLQGRHGQVVQQQAAVGVRAGAQAVCTVGDADEDLFPGASMLVEEFLGPVRAQPPLQLPQVVRVLAYGPQRHLVRSPGALHREAVDLGRPGPALGCA